MSIRIESKHLSGLLTDLARTSSRGGYPSDGVLLHSARGPIGDEPGIHGLLVGTSYGTGGIGYCFVEADGQMDPMLWPIADVDVVLNFLSKIGRGKKDHAVVIHRTGDEITVAEDPTLFGDGTSVRFTSAPLSGFSRRAWLHLQADEHTPLVPAKWTDIPAAHLAPFRAIAARRGAPVRCWTYRDRGVLVQIGPTYRGLIGVYRDPDGEDPGAGPDVDLYTVDLPDRDEQGLDRLLAEAASIVITLQQARPELLQRKLRVGEPRARALLAALADRGVVSAPVGTSLVRDVLISVGERAVMLDKLESELAANRDLVDDLALGRGPDPEPVDEPVDDGQGDLLDDTDGEPEGGVVDE